MIDKTKTPEIAELKLINSLRQRDSVLDSIRDLVLGVK